MYPEILVKESKKLGIDLNNNQIKQFVLYYNLLEEWNKKINLTSITEFRSVQIKHFLDSLATFNSIPSILFNTGSLIDIGTGAGFPGIPLKIALPGLKLTLLESTKKKTYFLETVSKVLKLNSTTIINKRAEDLAHDINFREKYDLATVRAVGNLAMISELCLPFCKIGGKLIALKNPNIQDEIKNAEHAIKLLGGKLENIKNIKLTENRITSLIEIFKQTQTDNKYPRKPGIPKKHPL